jgi:hydrogenase maturation protease
MSAIARAVLYEGYILWPYRRSAPKNRSRWTFGAVLPPAWCERHPDDSSLIQGQYLVEGADPAVTAIARFLQVVQRRLRDDAGRWVDELDGHLAWEEATERSLVLSGEGEAPLLITAGEEEEPVAGGTVVRSWEALTGTVSASTERLERDLVRFTVRVRNTSAWDGEDRQETLRHALVSTHIALSVRGGAFVSAIDPPEALREHARACRNVGTWPVLAGEEGDRSQLLSAPIILEDHPRIAPESRGDLFDGGEIDQLLILNVLALSDEERREMAGSDPRAREILERCTALGADELMSLHGRWRHG